VNTNNDDYKKLNVAGTIDSIYYKITAGEVLGIEPDFEAHSIILQMIGSSDGILEVALSRNLIESTNAYGDDNYFVLIDNKEITFDERSDSTYRYLSFPFSSDSDKIEIIGTNLKFTANEETNTSKPSHAKSEFKAYAEDSDGDSLWISQHTLDVAGDADDRHLEIVAGIKDWDKSQSEPRIQIDGYLPEGKIRVYVLTVLKKTVDGDTTYFTGKIDVKRGERLAKFEVYVKWPSYSDGSPVRESPPVQTYKVIDSNPGYYENQSYKNRAYDDKKEFENKIILYASGIKTAEQSLAGLQYDSSEAQKKD